MKKIVDFLKRLSYNTHMVRGLASTKIQKGKYTMAYTDTQIAKIHAAAPLNLAIATELASEFGVSYRSVISKAKQLGVEYVKKAPATKKAKAENSVTKAELLTRIRAKIGTNREGDLNKEELEKICEFFVI